MVVKNLSAAAIEESVEEAARIIKQSQIIMIPGGFSGGDEPEGSESLSRHFSEILR